MSRPHGLWTHNKTGNIYMYEFEVINATNGLLDGQKMVCYRGKNGVKYVREKKEFLAKFTPYKDGPDES